MKSLALVIAFSVAPYVLGCAVVFWVIECAAAFFRGLTARTEEPLLRKDGIPVGLHADDHPFLGDRRI